MAEIKKREKREKFFSFKRTYKDSTKQQARFENFKQNMRELLQVKQEQHGTAEFGVNDLMDWSKEEKANVKLFLCIDLKSTFFF